MASAQEKTVARYHELMQVNAVAHLLRAGRQIRLFEKLRERQHTAAELCDALDLRGEPALLLLDALVSIGIVERYGDDYALSPAGQLLCQYDQDFGDTTWDKLVRNLRSKAAADGSASTPAVDTQEHFDHQAATQWIHTAAAIQVAETLNVGGESGLRGAKILDLGCGSAVWSCAMAHRDPAATITAVDHAGSLAAARNTAESIGISDRVTTIEADALDVQLPPDSFDITLVAQRISGLSNADATDLVKRAVEATKPGGRVVIIDLFRGVATAEDPAQQNLLECIEALRLNLNTAEGRISTLQEAQQQLLDGGLQQVQFAYLPASQSRLGIVVGVKPTGTGSQE